MYVFNLFQQWISSATFSFDFKLSKQLCCRQKRLPEGILVKKCSKKVLKIHMKTPASEFFFNKVGALHPATSLRRDSDTGVSGEFCKLFQNALFAEYVRRLLLCGISLSSCFYNCLYPYADLIFCLLHYQAI